MATIEDLQIKLAELDKQKEVVSNEIRRLVPVNQGHLEDAMKEFQHEFKKEMESAIETITKLKQEIIESVPKPEPGFYTSTRLSYSDVENTQQFFSDLKQAPILLAKKTTMTDLRWV